MKLIVVVVFFLMPFVFVYVLVFKYLVAYLSHTHVQFSAARYVRLYEHHSRITYIKILIIDDYKVERKKKKTNYLGIL